MNKIFKVRIARALPESRNWNKRWQSAYGAGQQVYAWKSEANDSETGESVYVLWAGGHFGAVRIPETQARDYLVSVRTNGKVIYLDEKQTSDVRDQYSQMLWS